MTEIKDSLQKLKKQLGKFKYALLILLIGVILMMMPPMGQGEAIVENDCADVSEEKDLEERLKDVLSCVEGAGAVEVLLSKHVGFVRSYQEDTQMKSALDGEECETTTVILSDDGGEFAVETMCEYPVYRGAVVVCQGADRAAVRLSIVQAVSCLTGLGSDQITVVKMKTK